MRNRWSCGETGQVTMMASQSKATKNAIDDYLAPATLSDALGALEDGEATILAGGTDLMVQTQSGRVGYKQRLVNIRRIDELRGISEHGGRICIGALVTITELLNNTLVAEKVPVLAAMADKFASNQIRNVATVGGNICNASPAGDSIPPFLVLDADVELACLRDGKAATRSVPITEFFTGPGRTVRASNELVTGISFAVPQAGFIARFIKSGPRPALEISAVSMALGGVVENDVFRSVSLSFGSVAPTAMRARKAETFLTGKKLDDETIRAAVETALEEVSPIDDVRASIWYRRHLVGVYLRRLVADVVQG